MKILNAFSFGDSIIRVLDTEEIPMFVVADLCRVLDINDPSGVAAELTKDEVRVVRGYASFPVGDKIVRREQEILAVTETGLRRLISRIDQPIARALQNWVVQEVLPVIHRRISNGPLTAERLMKMFERAKTGEVQMQLLRKLHLSFGVVKPIPPSPVGNMEHIEFFKNMIKDRKSGTIPSHAFRVVSSYCLHAPDAPNQTGWLKKHLFMSPVIVFGNDRARRMHVSRLLRSQPYCLNTSRQRMRFGNKGSMEPTSVWGIDADLHPLGYRRCTDAEYEAFVANPDSRDPRKGELYDLIDAIEKIKMQQ